MLAESRFRHQNNPVTTHANQLTYTWSIELSRMRLFARGCFCDLSETSTPDVHLDAHVHLDHCYVSSNRLVQHVLVGDRQAAQAGRARGQLLYVPIALS